jgi:alpha-mannosidase
MKTAEPVLYGRVRERIAEGRWEIVGGLWIEPDCNLPGGESFVRQGLFGQRFFAREFGKRCHVGFNPDSFGHAGTLPQILRGLGLTHYVFMRPMPDSEMPFPEGTTFWWEGSDGSRVLTSNLAESYNADEELPDRMRRFWRDPHLLPAQRDVLCFYGVGNHGGGPTKRSIAAIHAAQSDPAMPQAVFSTLSGYFTALESRLDPAAIPTYAHELQHHARGCYSAHARMKRWMRRAEHAVLTAERWAAATSHLEQGPYPGAELAQAWEQVLYNQFHDIIAGTSIAASYEDTRDQLGAACAAATAITNHRTQGLARDIDTTPAGNTIVVFNPLPWPVREPVLVSPIVERCLNGDLCLVDHADAEVPVQRVRGERVGDGQRRAFLAEVPALGYRCYHLREGAPAAPSASPLEALPNRLANRWWQIDFDPAGGHWQSLRCARTGRVLLREGAVLACLADHSDTWSHGVAAYRSEIGRFGQARLRVVDAGAVLATVRSVARFGESEAQVETTLYRDHPAIDLTIRVDWRAAYQLLKVAFETPMRDTSAVYEAPYGHVVRAAQGDEEPGQSWVALTGTLDGAAHTLALLNDGVYSFDALEGTLRATLLRSPAYAHHDPFRYDAETGYEIMDQGPHCFRLRLIPHAGDWQSAEVPAQAWAFNAPPLPHVESAHPGSRPPIASLLACAGEGVLCTVVKQAEDGDGLVLRLLEAHGRATTARILLDGTPVGDPVPLAPHALLSLRLGAHRTLRPVNLLEEPC